MARYIDADLLISEIDGLKKSPWYNNDYDRHKFARQEAVNIVVDLCIKRAPTADVQEVRHGKWIYNKDYDWFHCSECQCVAPSVNTFKEQFDYDWDENLISSGYEEYTSYIQTNYCPECGAKMDGKEDEE